MNDLDGYLARVGLSGRPGLAEVQLAHATSIPFENLDPVRGIPVSLDPDRIEEKLVARRRGGYCFEQNLLLRAALEALGFDVSPILARVRMGGRGEIRPQSHLFLRVLAGGKNWHVDVGFGADSPLEPIPFGAGPELNQHGWRYRIVEDGAELVLQLWQDGDWLDMYSFVPAPAVPADLETANWYVCTHPRSPFVTGIRVGAQSPGRRAMLTVADGRATLVERTPEGAAERSLDLDQVGDLLTVRFGLPGFQLTGHGIQTTP